MVASSQRKAGMIPVSLAGNRRANSASVEPSKNGAAETVDITPGRDKCDVTRTIVSAMVSASDLSRDTGVSLVALEIAALTSLDTGDDTNPAGIWETTAAVPSIAAGVVQLVSTSWWKQLPVWTPALGSRPRIAS
jgi:hypothetical protein